MIEYDYQLTMASLKQICAQLGFSKDNLNPRGNASVLQNDLQSFSDKWSKFRNLYFVAGMYLCQHGALMFKHSEEYSNYPRDCGKIMVLVIEALKRLRDAESVEEVEIMSTDQAETTDFANDGSEYLPSGSATDQTMSEAEAPIDSQLSEAVMEGTRSEIDTEVNHSTCAVADPPKPLSAHTKKDLVVIIKRWMDNHPSKRFPEVATYDSRSLQNHFAIEATLTGSEESVWVVRMGIVERYLGWVLDKGDGHYILLKAQYSRKHGGHLYFPWLGGDLEFSEKVIARQKVETKQKISMKAYAQRMKLDGDDVLDEHDITKADLEPDLLKPVKVVKRKQSHSSLSSFESLVPLLHRWTAEKNGRSKLAVRPKKQRMCVKKAIKAIKTEQQEDSSPVTAISEIRPSPIDTTVRESTETIHLSTGPKKSKRISNIASGSPTYAPATYDRGVPELGLHTPPSSIPPVSGLGTPYTPASNTDGTGRVVFHFYLSDPTLGAIPSTFSLAVLPTHKRFLTLAIAAYQTNPDPNGQVIAASVRISGVERPIVVRDDNGGRAAWEETKRVLCEKGSAGGRVEAEVRCIAVRLEEIG